MKLINDAVIYIVAHIIIAYNIQYLQYITKLIVDVGFDKNRWPDINLNVSCIFGMIEVRLVPSMAKHTSGYSD